MGDAFIIDAVRTPRGKGKAGGSLYPVKPLALLQTVLEGLSQRHHLETDKIDDALIGCVTPVGEQGGNIARTAVLASGWSESVPGLTLNRFCSSGLESVNLSAMKIMSGQAHLVVAGGVESMSRVPMGSDGGAWLEDQEVIQQLKLVPQGISADLIATLEGFDRETLDQFAASSQQKAASATEQGHFDRSMIPVKNPEGTVLLQHDEIIRGTTTAEVLSNLKPAFAAIGESGLDALALQKFPQISAINHFHHAGNSSGIVDGASAVLIGSRRGCRLLGLRPRARICAMATVGSDPTLMLTGPTPATQKALKMAGLGVKDIDLFEINEAFASVVLKAIRDLNIDPTKVNVNGGSIAMGHPLGATGGMLLGTLLDELERRSLKRGLVTMCIGAGMGIATIIERV